LQKVKSARSGNPQVVSTPADNADPTVFDLDDKLEYLNYQPFKKPSMLMFQDKLYLAPLTTVGNLPFRRICKEFGADITCGEMAMARSILEGQPSEWALLRRHESEDFFGVQICGNSTEELMRCTELISDRCKVDFIDLNAGCPLDSICSFGGGSGMLQKPNRIIECVRGMVGVSSVPITMKTRTGYSQEKLVTSSLIPRLAACGISALTVHGRTRQQRYHKLADYEYLNECAAKCSENNLPFFENGDAFTVEDYYKKLEAARIHACGDSEDSNARNYPAGIMIARGALIKPWIFTEIKEKRNWDISSKERFDMLRKFVDYGLENWGSDELGVEQTRRFLLEWLSFLYRYVPIGLIETLPDGVNVQMNWRAPSFSGRDDLETLMASPDVNDWIKISEMLLGPVRDDFEFIPKHRANAYEVQG
jgi:tRNA-dihydrouridine synthase 3